MMYVLGFDKSGKLCGGCVYKDEKSLQRPKTQTPNVVTIEVVDEATFDLYRQGYYRNAEGMPTAPEKIEPTPEELAEQALEQAKAERAAAVASITVTVDGMVFDGDEKAQERMARAVLLADSPEEQTEWVLADSTVAIVTAAQLRRACKLAGKNQTVLWVKPYEA